MLLLVSGGSTKDSFFSSRKAREMPPKKASDAPVSSDDTSAVLLKLVKKGDTDAILPILTAYSAAQNSGRAAAPSLSMWLSQPLKDGATLLCVAADKGFDDVVRLLLEHGADPNIGEAKASSGTPLYVALLREDDVCVRVLLDHGADPMSIRPAAAAATSSSSSSATAKGGETNVLHTCFRVGFKALGLFFLHEWTTTAMAAEVAPGDEVAAARSDGSSSSASRKAASVIRRKYVDVHRALLALDDEGLTPLHRAFSELGSAGEHLSELILDVLTTIAPTYTAAERRQLLLESVTAQGKNTLLHMIATNAELLDPAARAAVKALFHFIAQCVVVVADEPHATFALAEVMAWARRKNGDRDEAAHLAAASGNVQFFSLLSDGLKAAGAPKEGIAALLASAEDAEGNTPLHVACAEGNAQVATWLLASGYLEPDRHITKQNINGDDAGMLALASGSKPCLDAMLVHGFISRAKVTEWQDAQKKGSTAGTSTAAPSKSNGCGDYRGSGSAAEEDRSGATAMATTNGAPPPLSARRSAPPDVAAAVAVTTLPGGPPSLTTVLLTAIIVLSTVIFPLLGMLGWWK